MRLSLAALLFVIGCGGFTGESIDDGTAGPNDKAASADAAFDTWANGVVNDAEATDKGFAKMLQDDNSGKGTAKAGNKKQLFRTFDQLDGVTDHQITLASLPEALRTQLSPLDADKNGTLTRDEANAGAIKSINAQP